MTWWDTDPTSTTAKGILAPVDPALFQRPFADSAPEVYFLDGW